MKRLFSYILTALFTLATLANVKADSYEARSTRAERYFSYKEWSSALAMYQLMIDERPSEVEPYYKSIVAGVMIGDTITQIDMLERTQQCGIALNELFSGVKSVSFSIGEAQAYVNFLMLVKSHQPWLNRGINIYLLDYYSFRNDPTHTIEIAEELLAQTPDNVEYLEILAEAYTSNGNIDKAIKCYYSILDIDSYNYEALLAIGNYYAMQLFADCKQITLCKEDLTALAQTYLYEAYNLHPTPYVAQLLDKISPRKQGN